MAKANEQTINEAKWFDREADNLARSLAAYLRNGPPDATSQSMRERLAAYRTKARELRILTSTKI